MSHSTSPCEPTPHSIRERMRHTRSTKPPSLEPTLVAAVPKVVLWCRCWPPIHSVPSSPSNTLGRALLRGMVRSTSRVLAPTIQIS